MNHFTEILDLPLSEHFITAIFYSLFFQIFDLKGSMRNRLVSTSGKREADLVLLDENLQKREYLLQGLP